MEELQASTINWTLESDHKVSAPLLRGRCALSAPALTRAAAAQVPAGLLQRHLRQVQGNEQNGRESVRDVHRCAGAVGHLRVAVLLWLQGILTDVDNLLSETVEAKVRLNNTFNEFLILANTQFIENVRRRRAACVVFNAL